MKSLRRLFLSLILCAPLFSQTYTIGDSHAQVCFQGKAIFVVGSTYHDLNASLQGRGKFVRQLALIYKPKQIILAFGTNDAVSFHPSQFRVDVCEVLTILRLKFPQATISIWGPPSSPKLNTQGVVDNLNLISNKLSVPFIDRRPLTPYMFKKDQIHIKRGFLLLSLH